MKHNGNPTKRSFHIGALLMIAAMGVMLVQCEAHHPITAQFVAQGWRAHSVTVLPISHPDLPSDVAMDQAERIAQRIRDLLVKITPGEQFQHFPPARRQGRILRRELRGLQLERLHNFAGDVGCHR